MTKADAKRIAKQPGYAIIGRGIQSTIGSSTIESQISRSRKEHYLESDSSDASLQAEKLQVNYSGKVRVRITFYRRRLADYSRAISEKALVDCLQYAGLIEGDSEKEIWYEDGGQKKVESDQEERTEIELIYEEVDLDNLWVPVIKSNKSR